MQALVRPFLFSEVFARSGSTDVGVVKAEARPDDAHDPGGRMSPLMAHHLLNYTA